MDKSYYFTISFYSHSSDAVCTGRVFALRVVGFCDLGLLMESKRL